MSDWIEKDGKKYFQESYLKLANNNAEAAKRRIVKLEGVLKRLRPMIGWQGSNEADAHGNFLHCEYCGRTDEATPDEVQHESTCPVLELRAALDSLPSAQRSREKLAEDVMHGGEP